MSGSVSLQEARSGRPLDFYGGPRHDFYLVEPGSKRHGEGSFLLLL